MKNLNSIQEKFIIHWGEMGTRWGINRTVAQVHALLYILPRPLPAEEIAETLGLARSNVSTTLKELQGWRIIRLIHLPGNRRDHFESLKDVWEMFRVILDERRRREVDPTLVILRECIAEAKDDEQADKYTMERLHDLEDFFEVTTNWQTRLRQWPTASLVKLMKGADKLLKIL